MLIAIVLVALAVGAYLWWRRRQQQVLATAAWRDKLAATIADVKTARDLLHDAAAQPIAPDRLESLRYQGETLAAALGQLSTTAPDDPAKAGANSTAQALRSYVVAIEAEQLLRTQTPAASDDALADANVTRRTRAGALDEAIAGLEALDHDASADQP